MNKGTFLVKLKCRVFYVFVVVLLSVIGCSDDRSIEEKFDDIELGMSYDEIRDLMGEPDDITDFRLGIYWQYYTSPTPPKMEELLLILFEEGEVTRKQRLS
jgi:hypothetical protein